MSSTKPISPIQISKIDRQEAKKTRPAAKEKKIIDLGRHWTAAKERFAKLRRRSISAA